MQIETKLTYDLLNRERSTFVEYNHVCTTAHIQLIFGPQKDTLWDDLHILGIRVENTNTSF